jgi:hypothetical protein
VKLIIARRRDNGGRKLGDDRLGVFDRQGDIDRLDLASKV